LNQDLFDECLAHYLSKFTLGKSWGKLADEFEYPDGEVLRQDFKRERKRRGVPARGELPKAIVPTNCKILLYDIETTPILALVWDIWNQNINTEAILQDWHIISWGAKWLFDPDTMSDVLTPKEALAHDDRRITKSFWDLLEEADVVIGHNSNGFDNKRINTRFLYHGLPPAHTYQSIDTLSEARRIFDITSNKLDYINKYLGLQRKTHTNFELWLRVWKGDPEALKEMGEYNKDDVYILEDLFLRLRPFIKGVANLNLWDEEYVSVCPSCGSSDLNWKVRPHYTTVSRYPAFRCNTCGAVGRSKKTDLDLEKRRTVVR